MLKKNPTYGKQRISRSMQIVGPIQLHFFIRKLQVMNVLLKETDWLCYTFFSSGNCRWWTCSLRRQTGFATHFFIRKLQVMDLLFKETDWLCSAGTSFAPLGELHERGQTHKRTDFATTRKNQPKGRPILWNCSSPVDARCTLCIDILSLVEAHSL